MGDFGIRTLGGGRVVRIRRKSYGGTRSAGDPVLRNEMRCHVESHVGPIAGTFAFPAGVIGLEVLWVEPSENRRFHTLVTCGMAERPMCPPPEAADLRFAELSICLPPEWPIDSGCRSLRRSTWPLEVLGNVAHYTHENETWVWYGHTLGAPVSGVPFAPDTRLTCVALGDPLPFPPSFRDLRLSDRRRLRIFNMIPIYAEEQRLAMWRGTEILLERLESKGLTAVLDVQRECVAKNPAWTGLGPSATILPFPRRRR